MDLAGITLKHRTTTWVLVICILFGGWSAYESLGRLEDPEFTIKEAKIITPYPGATPAQVAEEVTDLIEKACQQLGQIKRVTSTSQPGQSIVTAVIQDQYDKATLPQVWDELRRKIGDVQRHLPPGAGPTLVNDDFGDVFGVFLAVYGDGYDYAELKDHVDMLEKELLLVPDVAKVTLYGTQQEVIYIEINRQKLGQLGVSEGTIYRELSGKNVVEPSGQVQVDRELIQILPVEGLDSVESIGNILIQGLGTDSQLYLKDIATITRGYVDPPSTMLRFDGRPAIGMGVSTVPGGNVVTVGNGVRKRMRELEARTPIGIETGRIYFQADGVVAAVNSFVVSLLEAILIVIGVLVFAMGMRSGMLIGAILLLTVLATLIVMQMQGIALERISLGALIIALGMLVDNAIVVTEGIQVAMERGQKAIEAASEVVKQTMWPLLGATFVAILAFAALGASDDSTGEFCRSLYQVILASLLLSWLLAVTITPLFCVTFLKVRPPAEGEERKDPYGGRLFRGYRALLHACIRRRYATIGICVLLLAVSIKGFQWVDNSFFPDSTTPQFTVDYWVTEGTDIRETSADLQEIEKHILGMDGVTSVATCVGAGAARFLLTYQPEQPNTAYGQMIISVEDYNEIGDLIPKIEAYVAEGHPDSLVYARRFVLGPGGGSKIEFRIRGPNPTILRRLSAQAQAIMRADPEARDVRDDWRARTKVIRPHIADARAARAGVTREKIAQTFQRGFGGLTVGLYREGDKLIPIKARAPGEERMDASNVNNMQIWSPTALGHIPMAQVIERYDTVFEDHIIQTRNRMPTIKPQCNATGPLASPLFKRIKPKLENMEQPEGWEGEWLQLPPDYDWAWGGEYENSGDATAAIAGNLPITFLMMVLIVLALFNAIRQPLVIFLTVPLGMIGVTGGLLLFGAPFGFMALLGLLSLIGMMIKNAVVLVDEMDSQIASGKERIEAVLDSGVSRLRPVSMAAFTTVLGMIPLLPDAFFRSLAVTIMGGLGFATILTLIFVPVLYAALFKIPSETGAES